MKPPESGRDLPARPPPPTPPARARAELIENLAVLVVRKHRQRCQQPAADPAAPSSLASPTPQAPGHLPAGGRDG